MVAPSLRGTGVGAAVMRLLLGHPEVRGVRNVALNTRDAQRFYDKFGFRERPATEVGQPASTTMVLQRTA